MAIEGDRGRTKIQVFIVEQMKYKGEVTVAI